MHRRHINRARSMHGQGSTGDKIWPGRGIFKNDMPGPEFRKFPVPGLSEFSRGRNFFTQYFTEISEQISIILPTRG